MKCTRPNCPNEAVEGKKICAEHLALLAEARAKFAATPPEQRRRKPKKPKYISSVCRECGSLSGEARPCGDTLCDDCATLCQIDRHADDCATCELAYENLTAEQAAQGGKTMGNEEKIAVTAAKQPWPERIDAALIDAIAGEAEKIRAAAVAGREIDEEVTDRINRFVELRREIAALAAPDGETA